MLAEDSTCLSKEDIDPYLDWLISSPHFSFSLNYLKLANMDNEFLAMLTEISLVRKDDEREEINYRYSYLG